MYAPLTDNQWKRIGRHFRPPAPRPLRKADRRGGRPRLPDRACFDALLWTFFHGRAEDLPRGFGSARTLRRRVREWRREGRLVAAWHAYIKTLEDRSKRELAAALAVRRDELDWRSDLRFFLNSHYGDKIAEAALPPLTDKPLDPEIEKIDFSPSSGTKPSPQPQKAA